MQEKVKNTINLLWKASEGRRIYFSLCFFFMVIKNFIGMFFGMYLYRFLIDSLTIGNLNFSKGLFTIATFTLVSETTVTIFFIFWIYFRFKSFTFIKRQLRNMVFEYSMEHSINYFNNSFSGSLTNKIKTITDGIQNISKNIFDVLSFTAFAIAIPIFLAKISIILSMIFLAISTIYMIVVFILEQKMNLLFKEKAESQSRYFGTINDNFTNIGNIKTFNGSRREFNRIRRQDHDILRKFSSLLYAGSRLSIANFVFKFSLTLSIFTISMHMLVNGTITLGSFLFIVTLLTFYISAMENAIDSMVVVLQNFFEIQNSMETFYKPLEIVNRIGAKKMEITNGKITFKNLNFNFRRNIK